MKKRNGDFIRFIFMFLTFLYIGYFLSKILSSERTNFIKIDNGDSVVIYKNPNK